MAAGRRGLRVAMVGTRGVPARYGGFETAVEEIGRRLVERGHHVTVYRRGSGARSAQPREHLGMQLVTLPALRAKTLETLSHTAVSSLHAVTVARPDVAFVFNVANAPLLPLYRLRRIPVAVHVDGLEWQRSKWAGTGKRFFRVAERLGVRWADALIADAAGIADYYRNRFDADTELLSYGAPILVEPGSDKLATLDLASRRFHLVVARFEPENNVDLIVRGYRASPAADPLVVVGSAPYSDRYTAALHEAARGDARIRFLGAVWDQELLDQLYANCTVYLHGHSVGGTNPSLLRAMGAGAAAVVYDVRFNLEVVGPGAWCFSDEAAVSAAVERAESDREAAARYGSSLRERAAETFRWDDVADGYDDLARRLAG
jgi:glycosyltransferase involved in cell wall biosynthesis